MNELSERHALHPFRRHVRLKAILRCRCSILQKGFLLPSTRVRTFLCFKLSLLIRLCDLKVGFKNLWKSVTEQLFSLVVLVASVLFAPIRTEMFKTRSASREFRGPEVHRTGQN